MVLRLLPKPFTTGMITTAIPAAIKPYSIAVAPDSFFKKVWMRLTMRKIWAVLFERKVNWHRQIALNPCDKMAEKRPWLVTKTWNVLAGHRGANASGEEREVPSSRTAGLRKGLAITQSANSVRVFWEWA